MLGNLYHSQNKIHHIYFCSTINKEKVDIRPFIENFFIEGIDFNNLHKYENIDTVVVHEYLSQILLFDYDAVSYTHLSEYVRYIEEWAKVTFIVPPRMDEYIAVNMEIQQVFQNYGSPDDIYPYSIDEGFIDLTSSLNYFVSD